MTTPSKECQAIVTGLRSLVDPYVASLPPHPQLTINNEQLWVFAPIYAESKPSVILLLNDTNRTTKEATHHLNELVNFLGVNQHWHHLEGELTTQESAGDIVSDLSQTIHYFLQPRAGHHFVLSTSLLDTRVPDPAAYQQRAIALHQHETVKHSTLLKNLVDAGFQRSQLASEPGTFSVQGEQITIRLPIGGERYTIVLSGSTIEQLVRETAGTTSHHPPRRTLISSLSIPPVAFPNTTVPVRELLPHFDLIKPLAQRDTTPPGLIFDALNTDHPFPFTTEQPSPTTKPLSVLFENYDRVSEYFRDHELEAALWCQSKAAAIPLSLISPTCNLVTEGKLFTNHSAIRPISHHRALDVIGTLTPNGPAVHSDHGIGLFEGLQTRTIANIPKEYIILRYAAGDTLSVPIEYAHKVTPYLGEKTPTIHRLGGTLWQKTRRAAEVDAEAFARDLLTSAAARESSEKHPYIIYADISDSLEQSFPFTLTSDQETVLATILDDLQQPRTLDRVIVGDVGFGKTEIALRAARHIIANGKQVALLAPTTLLVQQHSDTARLRFPDLSKHIDVLSRFVSSTELKKVRHKIESGELKLVIGTHALLSSTTHWHNLGLVIIDEEQRFGVKHKEHFKNIRATVDFLSLSATPIPRTLSMALSGLKDLSVITSPPADRKDVLTKVTRFNENLFKQALDRELTRGGQIYVVASKVRSLGALAHQVRTLVPEARVAIAHGQMPAVDLAAIMRSFDTRKTDILVSSSIIENGLDLPNANTIIVMQATHFGLSDLYQLRGRVGRRERQGYATFFYNQTDLTDIQRQRLTALTEASRLGAGWSLAQRDLEIRGAGNLLGAEQSGTVNQVGVQFYLDLVRDAVAQHSETHIRRHEVDIKLPVPALIPQHYVALDDKRTQFYQQLARAGSSEELTSAAQAMIKTFGPPPIEVTNLILLLHLQHAAASAGITHLEGQSITPPDEDPYWRLKITTKDVPSTLKKLQPLGTWTVRNNTLTYNLNDITPEFVHQLFLTLSNT